MMASLDPAERIALLRRYAAQNDDHSEIIARSLTHPAVADRFTILWDELTGRDKHAAVCALFELVHGVGKYDVCRACFEMGVVAAQLPDDAMCAAHAEYELAHVS